MNSWLNIFFFSVVSAALMLSVMGLWFTVAMPGIDRWSKRFFQGYFIVLLGCCIFTLADMILTYYAASIAVLNAVVVVECLFLSLPLLMLTIYLLHSCGENLRESRLFRTEAAFWAAYFALLISSTFTESFSYDMQGDQVVRGPLYPLLLVPLVVILALGLAGTVRRRAQLSRNLFSSLLAALVPMTVALVLHMFIDVFPLIDIGFVLASLVMYGLILSDQIKQDRKLQREIARQQQEIASQRASIMVLQMRPHFIYNTMTSIYCLCKQDPDLAQRVTLDFTTYLRNNFTAIASEEPIPFSAELEHTRAYLAVEQAYYEDSLFVEYDTPHTMFRMPPLTLQPIVENAVKHGRDPYAGPFHISIRTRHTDDSSEIIVADDGRGFDPVDDGEPHIALKNIRQRLELMCSGSLTIAPNDGGGTVVTVTIPDRPVE